MPVTTNGVRTLLRVAPTPKDKGLTATFEVTAYDMGWGAWQPMPSRRPPRGQEAISAAGPGGWDALIGSPLVTCVFPPQPRP
jgi:hypothetical protein